MSQVKGIHLIAPSLNVPSIRGIFKFTISNLFKTLQIPNFFFGKGQINVQILTWDIENEYRFSVRREISQAVLAYNEVANGTVGFG
jgi:hypothetical protein